MKLDIIERDEGGMLVKTGTKEFLPAGKSLNKWVPRPKATEIRPPMNGALGFRLDGKARLECVTLDTVAYYCSKGNDVQNSISGVCLTSGPDSGGNGWSIIPDNFMQSIVCFAARKLVKATWLNDRDEFSVPDISNSAYGQFSLDSVIWSMFHGSNQTSSLDPVEYKGNSYDIINHFFWFSKEQFISIPALPRNIYTSAGRDRVDRFLPGWLEGKVFSDDAAEVLELGKRLIVESLPKRAHALSKYQLHRWDAGWYQVRMGLYGKDTPFEWTDGMKEAWGKFKVAYAGLTERLRPMIYELGFLPR
jgi:hypothetical protein